MEMKEQKLPGKESLEGINLHPRQESWARITTHNSLVGFGVFLAFGTLFVIVINLHLSRSSLAALGVLGALILVGLLCGALWRSTPQRRRGILGNAVMTARIKADLLTELGASHVNVDSANDVVTLRGSVPYADFAEAAEELARQHGAHHVINELQVVPSAAGRPDLYLQDLPGVTTPEGAPEAAATPSLEELVREALEADPRVNAYVIIVRVEDGMAYLTGRQDTVQARDATTEVAAHVLGIRGVANDIEIMPSV